jgi:nicotinamide-nucleotide amidase
VIVEVVAVGTELLLGQIVNTNAASIGSVLAEHGHSALYQQVVGDNLGRVADSLRTAIARSDAVIITGGIGPTQDDLTREALCDATGREMMFSDEYATFLREWWERRGRVMPESNLKQAEYPEGAVMLPNPRGTAPGLMLEHEETLIFCVPGVPAEMEFLLESAVIPALRKRAGADSTLVSRLLRSWGRSESDVAETLADLYAATTNPSVAFLASGGEIKVRISAMAEDAEAAAAMLEPLDAEVRSRLGDSIFGVDDETIQVVLFRLLEVRGWKIGAAESVTGGLLSAALTEVAGSSQYFVGGVVAYQSRLKQSLLGVSDVTKVVNEQTALAMAEGVREMLGVEVGVAITGEAGPNTVERPAGTIVVAVSTPEGTRARELAMVGDRERIRTYGVTTALHLTRLALEGKWWRS